MIPFVLCCFERSLLHGKGQRPGAISYALLKIRNLSFLVLNITNLLAGRDVRGTHGSFTGPSYRPNAGGGAASRAAKATGNSRHRTSLAPTPNNMQHLEARFSARLLVDDVHDVLGSQTSNISSAAFNAIKVNAARASSASTKSRDRSDRATVEQVLDPRTRMVLFKMLNRGVFSDIQGCISTGKEANVYYAIRSEGDDLAIKVYKTAILVFKDRDRYVVGDSRFQRFCKSNPRKMVKMWAEKEMRNLSRLHTAGIPCPRPVQLRLHVLAMEFLGKEGVAAPRLKDAGLPPSRLRRAYTECVLLVRNLYQKCRLVHADLSEYNLLVHDDEIYVIDVSQSVELDHPRAFDFLREDCSHINDYFRRQGVATLTAKELFDFAVDPSITDDSLNDAMDALMAVAAQRPIVPSAEEEVAERVWKQTYIPKKLEEIIHYERDHERLQEGKDTEGIYYQTIAGMRPDMTGVAEKPAVVAAAEVALEKIGKQEPEGASSVPPIICDTLRGGAAVREHVVSEAMGDAGIGHTEHLRASSIVQSSSSKAPPTGVQGSWESETDGNESAASLASEGDEDVSSEEEEGEEWVERRKPSKEEIKNARKENKKMVKETKAEKRKTKVPKHIKKRATKGSKKKR